MPGTIRDTAKHFSITNSEYLNISIDSSEIIEANIESVPHMILIHLEPSLTAVSSQITISNLEPNTTYWWHQDTHRSSTPFTTDITGSHTYVQDLTKPHLVFIKPEPSTKYVSDDATGGDCTTIGTWNNSTKTCTLTTDLTETVEIQSNGITLDGNGHTIIKSGTATGYGVYLYNRSSITIKNFDEISNFYSGIYLYSSSTNTITGNTVNSNNGSGIDLFSSSTNTLTGNTANLNNQSGIFLQSSNTNTITGNTANLNNYDGIAIPYSTGNILDGNTVQDNRYDINPFISSISDCNNTITNTTGSGGRPIKYFNSAVNLSNETLSQLILCDADGSSIDNVIIDGSSIKQNNGLSLSYTDDSVINIVDSSNNGSGIYLYSSSNNTLTGNTVNLNGYAGIYLNSSSNNTLTGNTANSNNYYGIQISGSNTNTLTGNTANLNINYGIQLSNSNTNILTGNTVSINLNRGINLHSSSNNQIYNNNFINNVTQAFVSGGSGNTFNQALPTGGNYWSNFTGCSDSNNDKICDSAYTFSGSQDNYPWTIQDGWPIPIILQNLNQYKSDNDTEIGLGGTTTESWEEDPTKGIISFAATLPDTKKDWVGLQIELRPVGEGFDESTAVFLKNDLPATSGGKVFATANNLEPGQYKWRARAVDALGNTSVWQHFGDDSDTADLTVKLVPLYTQIISDYPSEADTDSWDHVSYADGTSGNYKCGSTIAQCGCALTSSVMVLRYHSTSSPGVSTDPGALNTWLQNPTNKGYVSGSVNWDAVAKYSGYQVKFKERNTIPNNTTLLNSSLTYLGKPNPVIVYEKAGRGGINQDHFLIVDNKINSSVPGESIYHVKDPAWYNTRTLNDPPTTPQQAKLTKVRGYNNEFDGLRVYIPWNGIAYSSMTLNLASPAEFLVTDPNGDRLGKDPVSGIEYNEITDATYGEEGIGDGTDESSNPIHRNKVIHIPNPIDGDYDIQVMGTGEGGYTVTSSVYDPNGDLHSEIFEGNTKENITTEYTLEYDSITPSNIDISPDDITAPTTTISLAGTLVSGWYTSGTLVTLSATDNSGGVGVWKTEYSLDGGTNWITYTNPFAPPDADNLDILYRSEDYMGNLETYGTTTIDIDQSAPEAETYFDVINQEVVVNGSDNLSTPTVTKVDDENYTIADHMGHTLKINLVPTQTGPTLTDPLVANIKLVSLQYNTNDPILLPTTNLNYEYGITPITSLNEAITSLPQLSVTGVYNPMDDTTNITGFQDTNPITETLSGIKIIKLQTNKGDLEVEY